MGIYEDWQIHTKTDFRPIKLQGRRSGPHINRMSYNNIGIVISVVPTDMTEVKVEKQM